MRHVTFALLLCALASCRSAASDPARALLEADRAFARDVHSRGIEGWVAWFDESGSQVDDEFHLITGHEAIHEHMGGPLSDPDLELTWEPDTAQISEGGGLGTTSGRFRVTSKDQDGKDVVVVGRYFDVWRKQSDGSWKLLYDVGDFDPRD